LWRAVGAISKDYRDIQYLDGWSLWLDLKILARTIPAVAKGSGAA